MEKLEGLSLFFPCYNEEANIESVVRDALRVAPLVSDQYEIIVVDDGSRDETAAIVNRLQREFPVVRLVRHNMNRGYGEALKSGFSTAKLDWVFYSDGDGQFDLDELPALVEKTQESDIVSGVRLRRADSWLRVFNAKLFEIAVRIFMGLNIPDIDGAFKIYRRDLFHHILLKTSGAMIDTEILVKAQRLGYRITTVGVRHLPRRAGAQSGGNPRVILRAMKEFWQLWWELRNV
jgi:glycosyltransferase involved in cell wall biosynthesis